MKYTTYDKVSENVYGDQWADWFIESHMEEIEELERQIRMYCVSDYDNTDEAVAEAQRIINESDIYGIDTSAIYDELEEEGIKI